MEPPPPIHVTAADSSFVINFLNVDRMDLLARLVGYRFHVPREVESEIEDRVQKERFAAAVAADGLVVFDVEDLAEMSAYASYTSRLGAGEAMCLAVATSRGWCIAVDDRKARAIAVRTLGTGRVLTTPGAIVLAVRQGILGVKGADDLKTILETRYRFKMVGFGSFGEIV